jgi:hypothetical protein
MCIFPLGALAKQCDNDDDDDVVRAVNSELAIVVALNARGSFLYWLRVWFPRNSSPAPQ